MKSLKVFTLSNDLLKVELLNIGASLIGFESTRDHINIVARFKNLDNYFSNNGAYLGTTIGPCAGRMANSKLDTIQLLSNEANNSHLHGGNLGLHTVIFDGNQLDNKVMFTASVDHSADGYPGYVNYKITYELIGDELILKQEAIPENAQYINMTNHSYFNLDSSDSILEHYLTSNADSISLVNEFGWNLGEKMKVDGTPFDFRNPKVLKDCIESNHEQFIYTRSLDHFFYGNKLRLESNDKYLDISTDQKGFQLYSSNYFDENFEVEDGSLAKNYSSLAIEPQSFNNEPNLGEYPKYSNVDPYFSETRYKIGFK